MLDVQSIHSTQLKLDADHSHVDFDCLEFSGFVVEFRFLEKFLYGFQLFVCQFQVFAGLVVLFFGAVAASDIVEEAKLKVEVFGVGVSIDDHV